MPPERSIHAPAEAPILDLFAGPGGLDVAAEWLGYPATGIEFDPNACATRKKAGLRTVPGDVRDYKPADFPEASILTGGPPCQTFTVAGTGVGRRALDRVRELVARMGEGEDVTSVITEFDDERTGLVLEPLRWAIEAINSERAFEVIVLEQVPAVLPVWEAMADVLKKVGGYRTDCDVLRTEQYGVPQTRRRAVLVARLGHQPHLPSPTHRPYRRGVARDAGDPDLLPWVTMDEALDRSGPFTVVSNYGTGGDPRARGERDSDQPAATVTGKISRNRIRGAGRRDGDRFTESESGRLQTFPYDYPWAGKDVGQQIGNAIPPRLAAHVLASVLDVDLEPATVDTWVRDSWWERTPLVDRPAVDLDVVPLEPEPAR